MKLYIEEPTGRKVYLNIQARNRSELAAKIKGKSFKVNNKVYTVADVKAERNADNTALGMVIGGALGLAGGAFGVAAGTAIGAVIGRGQDEKESSAITQFNGS